MLKIIITKRKNNMTIITFYYYDVYNLKMKVQKQIRYEIKHGLSLLLDENTGLDQYCHRCLLYSVVLYTNSSIRNCEVIS